MASYAIAQVPVSRDLLGESPVWDWRSQTLYWADQLGRKLRSYAPTSGEVREWTLPHELGCVALTVDPAVLLVAQPDHYVRLHTGSGELSRFLSLAQPRPGVRLNDGRCDRYGCLIAGSVTTDGGPGAGRVWRIGPDASVEQIRDGMVIVNAICCSPAGDRLYYADSRGGVIYTRRYDATGNELGEESVFADLRPYGGVPDGATVDASGAVWIAQIMRGHILRLRSDGTLDLDIEMPAPHVSSLTFGGPNLDVLYVTSVRETGMLISSSHPLSGGLFAITGLGVRGVEEGVFGLDPRVTH